MIHFSEYKGAGSSVFEHRYPPPPAPLVTALIFGMYFSTIVTFAALPFLVGAVPVSLKSSRTDRPISIPLSRRSNLSKGGESIDLGKLKASRHHATAFVFPFPTSVYEKVASLTHCQFRNERRDVADLSLTVDGDQAVWTGQVAIGTPPKPYNSQSIFWGNINIKTDRKMCSGLRHVYRRYNRRWRYLWLDLHWKKPLRYFH